MQLEPVEEQRVGARRDGRKVDDEDAGEVAREVDVEDDCSVSGTARSPDAQSISSKPGRTSRSKLVMMLSSMVARSASSLRKA